MSEDAQAAVETVRGALAFMRDCGSRAGEHGEAERALLALDALAAHVERLERALQEAYGERGDVHELRRRIRGGDWETPSYPDRLLARAERAEAEVERFRRFVQRLVALDGPDHTVRRTVTLSQLIEEARAALEPQEPHD